jgi:HK97 family phage portal protein
MPVDVFRRIGGVQVEQQKPPVMIAPGGSASGGGMTWIEHLYATRVDLDSTGNAVGVIRATDGAGRPAVIELADVDTVSLRKAKSGEVTWKIDGTTYEPHQVWHERQFTASGSRLGLSPIAHAALTLSNGLSAQEFADAWFGNSAIPAQHLKNTGKILNPGQAEKVRQRYKATIEQGDVFVTGKDWELSLLAAKASESSYLEQIGATALDVCRFLGVPGDMVDVANDGSSVTYANVTQRNMQLLVINLGPALTRREEHYSLKLLPAPRYMKFNTGALLRMDLKSRYEAYKIGVDGRWLTPSRIHERENEAPFTPEEEAEFARLFPRPTETSRERELAELVQKLYLGVGVVISEDEARLLLEQAGMDLSNIALPNTGGIAP